MSVAQIKTALNDLSPMERREVAAHLQRLPKTPTPDYFRRITKSLDDMEAGKFYTRREVQRTLAEWDAKGI